MSNVNRAINDLAAEFYYQGLDTDPELMGKGVKNLVTKIKKGVKKLKKSGGLSVTTGKGSLSYGVKPEPVIETQQAGFDFKNPLVIGGAALIVLLFVMNKKKRK
jgi:hypothetical protein